MSVDESAFRKAMGCFASGVTVVTACTAEGQPVGLTVSAFSSVSLRPPLVLICLGDRTSNLESFRRGPFAVNILAESQRDISTRFAEKRDDRFDGISHAPGENGAPVLAGCLATVECDVHDVFTVGDHDIIVGAVTRVSGPEEAGPLVHCRGQYAGLA
ncbi:flavin reductase family protein [Rhodospira trueperi]|uniref:NADH-FMN oxidoreductase RutF, flavin reductase (DIM6/NTAB) family n=1 Tax=Rhodospira trueperi TaxID=69960 RepID=A0A1G6X9Y6_9PROT|nr:flavin reductase family protein [Rhodospira trueperi]SDD74918.1 NADH-FMN oxidoreductase RutF, flavin reductase (DIM6/NTAB) family [Rhodospira trueperi]